jgi:inorganic triphosphatase YgiF
MDAEPTRSIEIERKYDVDAETPLPDWTSLPGVTSVGDPESRTLDACYYDTDDLQLGRARVAVRRREGGPDAGWHVKFAAPDGKHEWHWPLDTAPAAAGVPDAVVAAVASWAAPPFSPIARIRNQRVAYALRDAAGEPIAEVVDDHVSATAVRTGSESSWREWEVELVGERPDAAAFFAAADAAVRAMGGEVATAESKLGRALAAHPRVAS